MASKFTQWFNERLSLDGAMKAAFDEKIPGGASFFYTLGSATLFVFTLQVLTGVWQLFYYVPTVDHAYDSLAWLRLNVPFGWLIQGIHYWGANIMAILVALHMIRIFIWGAYKKPRELTWIIGLFLLIITALLIFTGAALPWDERGYWAAEVGTSMAGTVPLIGKWLEYFLRGGYSMGQLTLSRFYVFHVAIIPGLAFIFIAFHLMAFRKFGSAGPWKESKRKVFGDFWPDQIAIDLIVSGFILLLIIFLSAYSPAPFTGPADPADAAFQPKPEWNFLFLYQQLKLTKGMWEIFATVGIPTVILLLLFSVPFLDRKPSRSPAKRKAMMFFGFLFVAYVVTFTIIGWRSKPPGSKENKKPATMAKTTAVSKKTTPAKPVKLSAAALAGKKVFETMGCTACHTMSGIGGKVGPDLTNENTKGRSRQWLMVQITDSKKHYPSSIMPDFGSLTKTQLNDLVDYLLSPHPKSVAKSSTKYVPRANSVIKSKVNQAKPGLTEEESTKETLQKLGPTGEAATIVGNVSLGKKLFNNDCVGCHGVEGKKGVVNPGSLFGKVPTLNPISKVLYNKNPQKFVNNIDRFIQHGATPPGPHPALHMLAFGDSYSLTQPEIANIESYILYLNGVNRAKIEAPGSAKGFFFLALWIYIGIAVILIIILITRKKTK